MDNQKWPSVQELRRLGKNFAFLDGIGDDGWQWAVDNGYTFPASNCSNRTADKLHPPVPTYVCCQGGPGGGIGGTTSAFNGATGVIDAVAMVQRHQNLKGPSTIPIQIATGTYQGPPRITATVRLESLEGP